MAVRPGRRLSVSTPYRLTKAEQEAALVALDTNQTLREEVLALLDLGEEEWTALPAQARIQALAQYEQTGAFAATLAAAARARRALSDEARSVRQPQIDVLEGILDAVHQLAVRIDKIEGAQP